MCPHGYHHSGSIYICNFHTKMNNLTQGSLGQAASSEDFSASEFLLYSTCTHIVLHSTLQRLCLYFEAITLQYKTGATCGLLNRNGH